MPTPVSFVCNICDTACLVGREQLTREAPTCAGCGSSVRTRAIVHLLSLGLFGRSLALRDFPHDRIVHGVGLSDWDGYAQPLAGRLHYSNTFFHQAPRLDIAHVDPALEASADFLIAADVFQHVLAPVQAAFDGARRLLRPGGLLVFTVPYDPAAPTLEHFPQLERFELGEVDGRRVLHEHRAGGEVVLHEAPTFHGGPGFTLEMRRFGLNELEAHLHRAGFTDVTVRGEAVPERGITWQPWSRPILARAAA